MRKNSPPGLPLGQPYHCFPFHHPTHTRRRGRTLHPLLHPRYSHPKPPVCSFEMSKLGVNASCCKINRLRRHMPVLRPGLLMFVSVRGSRDHARPGLATRFARTGCRWPSSASPRKPANAPATRVAVGNGNRQNRSIAPLHPASVHLYNIPAVHRDRYLSLAQGMPMSRVTIIENPILNSPFEEPRHISSSTIMASRTRSSICITSGTIANGKKTPQAETPAGPRPYSLSSATKRA